MFNVYDSKGKLLRGGFPNRETAENWIWVRANNRCLIKEV